MSDTFQMVRWSLGDDERRKGNLWLPWRVESPDDILWKAMRRLGLEPRIRSAFQVTRPLWYGLWIQSPLTVGQCSLLRAIFTEVVRLAPSYQKRVEDFQRALVDSIDTGKPLHVELMPPGHADFGWVTTFVHCPRCKAEGPVERWQETYPEEPLECPVCGWLYSPAATYSSEQLFAETICCPSCEAVLLVRDYPDDEIRVLADCHTFGEFREELTWLQRVAEFYKRHPDRRGKIKSKLKTILDSEDPAIQEALCAGLPFSEINLPSKSEGGSSDSLSQEDREVMDYLRHNDFSLPERMKFVNDSIERLKKQLRASALVKCTRCGGQLT